MIGVKGCPYCGGEVEVVKLIPKKTEKGDVYRISCLKCKMTVARGVKFEKETAAEGKQRIADYNKFIEKKFATPGSEEVRRKSKCSVADDDFGYTYQEISNELGITL